jgi:hypothetical protein
MTPTAEIPEGTPDPRGHRRRSAPPARPASRPGGGGCAPVTTCQADDLVMVRDEGGRLNIDFRAFAIRWGWPFGANDRPSVPRCRPGSPATPPPWPPCWIHPKATTHASCHVTGDVWVGEMARGGDDFRLVNTRLSCVCTLDLSRNFVRRRRPPFVMPPEPTDRCHLKRRSPSWTPRLCALRSGHTEATWDARGLEERQSVSSAGRNV